MTAVEAWEPAYGARSGRSDKTQVATTPLGSSWVSQATGKHGVMMTHE